MSNASEYSKPPSGRRHKAKIFYQENNFFEKTNRSPDIDEHTQDLKSPSMTLDGSASPAPLTHRSANFLNSPPPVKPRTKLFESNKQDENTINICLRGVFTLESKSIDLELTKDKIKWKFISENKTKNNSKYHDFEFKLDHFYSVEPKFNQIRPRPRSRRSSLKTEANNNQTENQLSLAGFTLHMFYREKINVYKPRTITFEHPHRETCNEWINKLKELLPVIQNERTVLVLLNPFAGERKTRYIFNTLIYPMFNTAKIMFKIIEYHEKLCLKDSLISNNICVSDFYGIVIMAGDSGVSKAINTIIELITHEDGSLLSAENIEISKKMQTPICIIPCGATNLIANSIYGSTDYISPLMFLIYGTTIKIDLSAVNTHKDKLHSFGFNYSCGFGSTLARYFIRYSKFGVNKVQTSLARGAAKQNHKAIDVEIEYLPIEETEPDPFDGEICVKGCKTCGLKENNVLIKSTRDEVENFAPVSNNKIKKQLEWKTLRGSFIHVSFLTNAALGLNTSNGLSKYGHLGDGCIDLILVEPVARKDFYRFIKRHTNAKNQLDFPFVKAFRIKEARIRILNNITSNLNNDLRFRSSTQSLNKNDEFNSDESDEDNIGTSREITADIHRSINLAEKIRPKIYFIKSTSNLADEQHTTERNEVISNQPMTMMKRSRSIIDIIKQETMKGLGLRHDNRKPVTMNENDQSPIALNSSRNKTFNTKTLKSPTIWNCDWNLFSLPEIHIKCNRQFLPVFASGLDVETDFEDASFVSCLNPI